MMVDEEALEVLFIATRVLSRCHWLSLPTADVDALRQLAETADERNMPAEQLARTVIARLFNRRESQREATSTRSAAYP
jgi:hypothetical protein